MLNLKENVSIKQEAIISYSQRSYTKNPPGKEMIILEVKKV